MRHFGRGVKVLYNINTLQKKSLKLKHSAHFLYNTVQLNGGVSLKDDSPELSSSICDRVDSVTSSLSFIFKN